MLKNKLLSAMGGAPANYIEDVFSTYLYTGNGATQTITNGIDLAGKGGLTWIKKRSAADQHVLQDTVRGIGTYLSSNTTDGEGNTGGTLIGSFNSNGFSLASGQTWVNASAATYASWTFRKQPKFFDVVTYTGNDVNGRAIPHSLGSVPGCILVKSTSSGNNWFVYHRSISNENYLLLNTTDAQQQGTNIWNSTSATSTNFTVGTSGGVNSGGVTYVAYLFAHDAGGFGLSGTENVVSCGSFSPNGSSQDISLGYEPQWILIKRTAGARDWFLVDNMRGWTANSASDNCKVLNPNLSAAESDNLVVIPTATGFTIPASSALNNDAHIYIAIRRGPMRVPVDGTKVFSANAVSTSSGTQVNTGFAVDTQIIGYRPGGVGWGQTAVDRLRGVSTTSAAGTVLLGTASTNSEAGLGANNVTQMWGNTGFQTPFYFGSGPNVFWSFRRAPSFFDEVCYTGDGTLTPRNHNLTVAPQLVITKSRAATSSWYVAQYLSAPTTYGLLNTTDAFADAGSSYPVTATTFVSLLASSAAEVTYLFATCAGVSKVGSYIGTGTTQAINCGFTAGARFVLIKRTDDVGDWYVWDSARGIVAGNDPHLSLNTAAAEVTTDDSVDTDSAGFIVNQNAATNINVTSATYIFLSVA